MLQSFQRGRRKRAEKKNKWSTGGGGGREGLRNVYAFQTALFRLHVSNDEAGERERWTTARETTKRNGNGKRARFIAYFHGSRGRGYRASTVKVKKPVSAGSNSARTSSNHINFQRAR